MKAKLVKIMATLMAVMIAVASFTACGDNNDEPVTATHPLTTQTDATTKVAEDTTEPTTEDVSDEETTEDASSEDTTVNPDETTTTEDETTKPSSTKADDKTTKPSTTKTDNKTTKPSTTKTNNKTTKPSTTKPTSSKNEMPETKAEIIAYYKAAAAKINSKKAGYTKTRETSTSNFDVPFAYKAVQGLIKGFMGIGEENIYKVAVAKGTSGSIVRTDLEGKEREYFFLPDVTLTAADVASANCVKSGKNYILTLNIKEGSSYAYKSDVRNNSPIDKAGVNSGNKDYDFFDHKTAAIMQNAIGSFIKNVKITEKTSKGKVVVTVDAATGNITNMTMTFDIYCEIKIVGDPIVAAGTTIVEYKNFKW